MYGLLVAGLETRALSAVLINKKAKAAPGNIYAAAASVFVVGGGGGERGGGGSSRRSCLLHIIVETKGTLRVQGPK